MHLQSVRLPARGTAFPFTLPFLGRERTLELDGGVTILVGENGTGKSTLLEALAWASERPVAGSSDRLDGDATLEGVRPLGEALGLVWTQRTRRGLYWRAEDYFGFVKAQNLMKAELRAEVERLRGEDPKVPELEVRRRAAPYAGSVAATEARYGGDLDAASHGESFMAFFTGRLTGPGLYLLDEPEAALSPLRQLAFIALVRDAVRRGAQFVIATHAPILMAYPGARLLELTEDGVRPAVFDELEHVRFMRAFLASPDAYLRHLE